LCAASTPPPPPPPFLSTLDAQVQKVTPEQLEVAIANRDKAILVDFFGAERRPTRCAWRGGGCVVGGCGEAPSTHACCAAAATAPPPTPPRALPRLPLPRAATWCGPCLLLAQELEKVRV
jgi:thiol-disulfide isomerase/thioredoxin